MPTYRIVTLGCKLNQADSAALEGRLVSLGFRRAAGDDTGAPSDVVILNTCTVTAGADREARQIARRLRRANPKALLIATGCYAQRDPGGLGSLPGVDCVVGLEGQEEKVATLCAGAFGIEPNDGDVSLGPLGATAGCEQPVFGPGDRTRALLKIQDGCDLRCSYCIIPSVRGPSRSLPATVVIERLARLIDSGFREIVVTGVNTGDYGRDLDPPRALRDLLESAVETPGLGRLRLNSLEPKTVTTDLVDFLAGCGGRVAPHLQIPLQSGSDSVLGRMRRPYRTSDYARVVEILRSRIDGIALGADVIAGFPGETDAEFESAFRFIESSALDYLHVFSYSPRPGTAAAARDDLLPPATVKERSARLRRLARDLSLRFRRSCVGLTRPALTLREVRPDGRLRALTDNFIDLGLDPGDLDPQTLMNRLVPVRITAATDGDTLGALAGG